MGILTERLIESGNQIALTWKERFTNWMSDLQAKAMEKFSDVLGKGLAKQEAELLDSILAMPDLPPELRALVGRAKTGGGEWQALLLGSLGGAAMGGAASSALMPPLEKLKQHASAKMPFQLLPMLNLMALKFRAQVDDTYFRDQLHRLGFADKEIDYLVQSYQVIPIIADLIRMAVREAFTPEIAERFGQYQDYPEAITEWGVKQGLSKDWLTRYWAAHWELPSPEQGYEMLHRGVIDEETLRLLLRALDVMPFWRDKLMAISWAVPTRVDIRRFWDMRTIDEARLRELYTAFGYHGKDLEDYILWTKVYVAWPDLLARFKNGWITLEDVRSELTRLGMPTDRVQEMIETVVKPDAAERTTAERALTKAEIVKGVKNEVISAGEGIELLTDMGYSEDEAEYILAINIEALRGSPETYEEFKDITQKYRIAAGKNGKPVPEELKAAATALVRTTKEVETLRTAVKAEEAKFVDETVASPEVKAKLTELRVALHRAEAELARVQSEYDRQRAAYKHGGFQG